MVCESSNINIFIGNFRTVKENFTISTNREPTWKLLSLLTVTADYQNPLLSTPYKERGKSKIPRGSYFLYWQWQPILFSPLPTGNGENPKSYMEVTFSTDSDSRLPKSSTRLLYLYTWIQTLQGTSSINSASSTPPNGWESIYIPEFRPHRERAQFRR